MKRFINNHDDFVKYVTDGAMFHHIDDRYYKFKIVSFDRQSKIITWQPVVNVNEQQYARIVTVGEEVWKQAFFYKQGEWFINEVIDEYEELWKAFQRV